MVSHLEKLKNISAYPPQAYPAQQDEFQFKIQIQTCSKGQEITNINAANFVTSGLGTGGRIYPRNTTMLIAFISHRK